jgi:hypothetical protein
VRYDVCPTDCESKASRLGALELQMIRVGVAASLSAQSTKMLDPGLGSDVRFLIRLLIGFCAGFRGSANRTQSCSKFSVSLLAFRNNIESQHLLILSQKVILQAQSKSSVRTREYRAFKFAR